MSKRCSVLYSFCFILICSTFVVGSVPFWGDQESQPLDVPPSALKDGQFVWSPKNVPSGPVVVVVSLIEQIAYVYRNGIEIGYAKVSTGKKGFETPTGVFTTLQKDKDHRSSIYNSAPMPYTQRLTWTGVALHAGGLPGYPSSHGCVHLPSAFAELLFQSSPLGMTVVISDDVKSPITVAHPGPLAPVDLKTGKPVDIRPLKEQDFRWEPEKSPQGPVSILISGAERRFFVHRNGIEIGRCKIVVNEPEKPLGTHVFVVTVASKDGGPDQWIAVGIPGHASEDKIPLRSVKRARITLPEDLLKIYRSVLLPGTTAVVTDEPVLPTTTDVPLTIITNNPAEK